MFLGTQFDLANWTLAQPGEDEAKCLKRRNKIKLLIQKALHAFCVKTAILTELRNRRDRAGHAKRKDYKEAVDTLKSQSRELWDLLKGLCARGPEEQAFLLNIKRDLIKASEEGKQAARRGKPALAAAEASDPQAGGSQEESTAEGADVPADPQPVTPQDARNSGVASKKMNPVVRLLVDPKTGGKTPVEGGPVPENSKASIP